MGTESIHPGINMRQLKRIAATNWRENPTSLARGDADGAGNVGLACSRRGEDVTVGRVFQPVSCCDSFQLAHVDTAFKASLFVAVSPYSGLMYVTAAANEKMPAWIECHVKALNYLGKVPAVIVPDNASTATYLTRACFRDR